MSPRATTVGLLIGGLTLLTACGSTPVAPTADVVAPSAPAGMLATPAPNDAGQLATLAKAAGTSVYAARYQLTTGSGQGAQLTVAHRDGGYRLDITAGTATDSLIGSDTGTVSCHAQDGRTACFQAAGAGQPLPDLFDAGAQHVFTDYLQALATATAQYQVDSTVPTMPPPSTPPSSCYTVTALTGATPPVVPAGTYCLAENGMPTLVTYGSASLVLQQVLPAPAAGVLAPPATPQPLPSAS